MAAVFALMAGVLVVVAVTGASLAPDARTAAGRWLTDLLTPVADTLAPIPNLVTALALLGGGVAMVWWWSRARDAAPPAPLPSEEDDDVHHACH
jgi:hypothetical protein